ERLVHRPPRILLVQPDHVARLLRWALPRRRVRCASGVRTTRSGSVASGTLGITRSRGGRRRVGHRLRRWMHLRWVAAVAVLAVAAPASAHASQLIDRNATHVRLEVNRQGQALLTYRAYGRQRRVLAWNAVNAVPPSAGRAQVAFRLDYSGGWGTY